MATITFVRAGFSSGVLSHIISFRRQIYIKHEDTHISKLHGSILINYEDDGYRTFITDDALTCYLCKRPGHTSIQSKSMLTINSDQPNTNQVSNPSQFI